MTLLNPSEKAIFITLINEGKQVLVRKSSIIMIEKEDNLEHNYYSIRVTVDGGREGGRRLEEAFFYRTDSYELGYFKDWYGREPEPHDYESFKALRDERYNALTNVLQVRMI